MKVRLYLLLCAFCCWSFPSRAASVPAVSNLGQPGGNSVLVGNNNLDSQVAVSFTTGPSGTELSSVTLQGFGFGGTSTFRIALYTGVSSAGPTGIVATLAGSASPGTIGTYTYTAAAPIDLAPSSTYWLVASAPSTVNPSGFSWTATSSLREDPDALSGWSIGDSYWITTASASWSRDASRIPQFSVSVNTRPEVAPIITIQPTPVTPFIGNNVTLLAAATSNPAPTFQWRKDAVAIPGATGNSLTLTAGSASNAGAYSVVVSNSVGSVTSQDLAVARPTFTTLPASQAVVPGTTVSFTASTSSTFPVSYQWLKDGVAIPASAAATLNVSNVQVLSAGNYSVVATNIAGSTTSAAATLSLVRSQAGHLTNLSLRTNAGTGTQALIVGFVIGGANTTGTKPLLMRGAGPALAGFGVSGFLADPTLSLFSGTTVVASNDNWAGDAQVATIGSQVGAFSFAATTSRDAALYNPTLGSGAYTIQIAGVGGTTGIALAEIYDTTPATLFFANTPRLINVSARTEVGTGTNILIAGFNISGNTAQRVLIRAIGPTLSGFGVTGTLADPKLDLFAGSSLFLSNDNWGEVLGSGLLAAAATSVGAFPLNTTSRDAVLLVTLNPGSYSAQVSGVGNTTGVALIEIYEVP